VYIGSRQQRYTRRDLVPLWHGAKHACILIESVWLADRLAREVASQERRRISRDLHDSAIQPYIGLKLGLEAMRRRLRGSAELVGDLDELIKIARDGIGELRDYVGSLKKAEARKQVTSLLAAVRMQAKKFAEFYGIDAQVIANDDIPVSAPLQQEIMHIVREGLSNIRRHTCAERATINLREAHGQLLVEVINDNGQASKRGFFPRSISERAKELGGRVSVQHRSGQRTVVAVELPLQGTAP
jgi:signal transduction histidine kinase